jgi:hypothetical protein
MEKTDMRIDALHNLAIEFEHKAQYAMRRRVLRSEIDGEVTQLSLVHDGPPFLAPARQWSREHLDGSGDRTKAGRYL